MDGIIPPNKPRLLNPSVREVYLDEATIATMNRVGVGNFSLGVRIASRAIEWIELNNPSVLQFIRSEKE